MSVKELESFIDKYQRTGRYSFTKAEALVATGLSENIFYKAAQKLSKKNRLLKVVSGFYIIIPFEYSKIGTLPPTWYIHKLMTYLDQEYYVGLLTAASIHGAAHHAPQTFQVIVNQRLRPLVLKGHKIKFYFRKVIKPIHNMSVKVQEGECFISNPAQTAVDLVRYYKNSGYMDNVATVLAELLDEVKKEDLDRILENGDIEITVAQRLGYLMDFLGFENKGSWLYSWLEKQEFQETLLIPEKSRYGFKKNRKWKVVINEDIEADV